MKRGTDYIGVGCGALIVNQASEVLLMKRTKMAQNEAGFWSKPGGAVELGETVEDAIKREVKEELNVEIELTKFLGYVNHILPQKHQHWIAISYLARIVGGELKNMEPDKVDEIQWFSLDQLPENLTQTTREPIQMYLHA